jgi:hypothetical protein
MPSVGSFNPTVVNTDSMVMPFVITNTGQAATPLLLATVSGTNAADFVKSSDTCSGATVAGGATCTVGITFRPTIAASRNASLTVSGAGLVPVVINLGGTGLTPASLSLSPLGDVPFGDVATNSSQSLSFGVTNTGQDTARNLSVALTGVTGTQFIVQSNGCGSTLAGGASCDVVVLFTPGTQGSKSATLTVSGTSGGSQVANLTGTGVAPGALSISPTPFDFRDVLQGQSNQKVFTVTNMGGSATGAPTVSLVGSGAGFSQTNTCSAAVPPNGSCTVTVTFAPTAPTRGSQSLLLQVSASPGGTTSASISGNAQAPALLSVTPQSASFPNTTRGATSTTVVTLTLSNTGDQTTGALGIARSLSDFSQTNQAGDCMTGATLAGGASCSLHVTFTPQVDGSRAGTITLSGTPGGSTVASFTGTGLTPATLAITGPTAFGNVVIPGTSQRTLTVTNTGQAPSTAVTYGVTSPFNIVTGGTCVSGSTLAAGASCTMQVQFTAAAPNGSKTGTLTASATQGGMAMERLTGVAQNPAALSPSTVMSSFGGVEVGQTATLNWVITNTGDVATPTLTTSGLAPPFSATSDTCNGQQIGPMSSCTVVIEYAPRAGTASSGLAKVTGASLTTSVDLSGTGLWRLKLTPTMGGVTGTLDGTISNCTSTSSATQCTALYTPGTTPTVRSITTNGSGFSFVRYAEPAGCTTFGRGRDCPVPMLAHTTVSPIFNAMDSNLVFASSVTLPANLGGTAPYDALCNFYATDAGINSATGTSYIAWMSTSSVSAASRLTTTGGMRRMDGAILAFSKADLLAGNVRNPVALDEKGQLIPNVSASFWTGTTPAGASNGLDCSGWTTNGTTALNRGLVFGGPGYWTDGTTGHTCNNSGTRVMCMRNVSATVLSTSSVSGAKRIGLVGPVARPTGVANADATCSATLANTRAIIAGVGTNVLNDTTTYVRFDNTVVGTGAEIKTVTTSLRSGIWQLINGGFIQPSTGNAAWTGSGGTGTNASTCDNWTNAAGTVNRGMIQVSSPNFMDSFGPGAVCNGSFYLYCAEQ